MRILDLAEMRGFERFQGFSLSSSGVVPSCWLSEFFLPSELYPLSVVGLFVLGVGDFRSGVIRGVS